SGSLGLDLETAVDVSITDNQPVRIKTTTIEPILINGEPSPTGALLLGRSSLGIKGLINKDYTGVIQIVVQTQFPPMYIPTGSRIAQLVPIPHWDLTPIAPTPRGMGGFGSTGQMATLTIPLHSRPTVNITLSANGQTVSAMALLDTGVGITIIS
ncbi:POK9 protein, partial [Upupa epops]|nr:POK9 protein [Upupa epops]